MPDNINRSSFSRGLDILKQCALSQALWYTITGAILVGLVSWFVTNIYLMIVLDIVSIYFARKVGTWMSNLKYVKLTKQGKQEAKMQAKYDAMGVNSAEIAHQKERSGKP